MGDFDKSINRREEPAPYEKIIVNPVEKDKKEKEPFTGLKKSSRLAFATLVSCFRKMLAPIASKGKGAALLDQQRLLSHVLAFRQMLLILSIQDESHNPNFTQKLTELWHNLVDDCNSLTYSDKSSEILSKVNFLLTQIQNYPLGADHTLGYYFTEYAGGKWIPFPFMELLQTLYQETQTKTLQSTLSRWISLLNEILGPCQEV